MIAFEADIHAVAGLLKRYFRELPDPLFTNELYPSFVQGLGKSPHITSTPREALAIKAPLLRNL